MGPECSWGLEVEGPVLKEHLRVPQSCVFWRKGPAGCPETILSPSLFEDTQQTLCYLERTLDRGS